MKLFVDIVYFEIGMQRVECDIFTVRFRICNSERVHFILYVKSTFSQILNGLEIRRRNEHYPFQTSIIHFDRALSISSKHHSLFDF